MASTSWLQSVPAPSLEGAAIYFEEVVCESLVVSPNWDPLLVVDAESGSGFTIVCGISVERERDIY